MERRRFFSARNVAYLAVLLALVVVMQTVGGAIKFGTLEMSFVLIPIVLGAILLGPAAGAFLGFVFGFITLVYGISGASLFTNILFVNHPVLTTLTCLLKGTAAGFVPGIVYRAAAKKNSLVAAVAASALAPICNTGIFIIGAFLMSGTIAENFVSEGSSVVYFIFIVCAGVNFLLEFAANVALSPAIHRIVLAVERTAGAAKRKERKEAKGTAPGDADGTGTRENACQEDEEL